MRSIRALTGLRFFAALYVFVFHVHIRWPLPGREPINQFISQGALGVTLFFILSGFILTHVYGHDEIDAVWLRGFALKRFARIYPIYALSLLLVLPFLIVRPAGQSLVLFVSDALLLQAWFPQLALEWHGSSGWTIGAEAFFYLCFPVLLLLLRNAGRRGILLFLAVAWAWSVFPGQVHSLFGGDWRTVYAMPLMRLGEFAVGVGACLFIGRYPVRLPGAGLLGALAITYLAAFGWRYPAYVGHNWIIVPLFVLLIAQLSTEQSRLAACLGSRILVLLGEASYAFYLMQIPLFYYLSSRTLTGTWLLCFALVVVNAVLAVVVHVSVEKPLRARLVRGIRSETHNAYSPAK